MVYNTKNRWFSGLCTSSGILTTSGNPVILSMLLNIKWYLSLVVKAVLLMKHFGNVLIISASTGMKPCRCRYRYKVLLHFTLIKALLFFPRNTVQKMDFIISLFLLSLHPDTSLSIVVLAVQLPSFLSLICVQGQGGVMEQHYEPTCKRSWRDTREKAG
jgi:hypothetical protein